MTVKNLNNEATNVSHPKISGDIYQWTDGRILVIDKNWAGMYLDWNAYLNYMKDAAADGGVLAMVKLKGNPTIEISVNGFFVSYQEKQKIKNSIMKKHKKILLEFQSKLEQIAKLPKPDGNGETFKGIDICEEGIEYNSATYYGVRETEEYSFFTTWEEIDKPLEYFEKKYEKAFKKRFEEIEERRKQEEEKEKQQRKKEYERLKREFEE